MSCEEDVHAVLFLEAHLQVLNRKLEDFRFRVRFRLGRSCPAVHGMFSCLLRFHNLVLVFSACRRTRASCAVSEKSAVVLLREAHELRIFSLSPKSNCLVIGALEREWLVQAAD